MSFFYELFLMSFFNGGIYFIFMSFTFWGFFWLILIFGVGPEGFFWPIY